MFFVLNKYRKKGHKKNGIKLKVNAVLLFIKILNFRNRNVIGSSKFFRIQRILG